VSFGNFLLKRVVDDLKRDYPRLLSFATLSPLPSFRRWAEKTLTPGSRRSATEPISNGSDAICRPTCRRRQMASELARLLADDRWASDERLARALQHGLTRLAARYLLTTDKHGRPCDPVARFHLGNGARIERLNYLADTSARGWQQSYGLMVNYLYDPDTIEANVEAFSRSGEIAAAAAIRRSARD
jgi:malonyl-CoA decarboxylase